MRSAPSGGIARLRDVSVKQHVVPVGAGNRRQRDLDLPTLGNPSFGSCPCGALAGSVDVIVGRDDDGRGLR
jgi:hypothetical protein